MYTTALLQTVARETGADFVTRRIPNGHEVVGEKIVFVFPSIPDCFGVGQIGVIQGTHPAKGHSVTLGRFRYLGNDNWIPTESSPISVRCMQFKLAGLD